MTRDKWEEIIALVENKFVVEEYVQGEFDDFDQSTTERIIFNSQLGLVKLEFVTRAKVIDKKVNYSNRVGAGTDVEYIYSPTEKTHRLLIYRWSELDNTWLAIDGESMNLF